MPQLWLATGKIGRLLTPATGVETTSARVKKKENIMDTKTTCHKKHILFDVVVEADLSGMCWYHPSDSLEERAKQLERAAEEFKEFLRDHRSQDMVSFRVERIHKNVCSACYEPWETDKDETGTYCMYCGAYVEKPDP